MAGLEGEANGGSFDEAGANERFPVGTSSSNRSAASMLFGVASQHKKKSEHDLSNFSKDMTQDVGQTSLQTSELQTLPFCVARAFVRALADVIYKDKLIHFETLRIKVICSKALPTQVQFPKGVNWHSWPSLINGLWCQACRMERVGTRDRDPWGKVLLQVAKYLKAIQHTEEPAWNMNMRPHHVRKVKLVFEPDHLNLEIFYGLLGSGLVWFHLVSSTFRFRVSRVPGGSHLLS